VFQRLEHLPQSHSVQKLFVVRSFERRALGFSCGMAVSSFKMGHVKNHNP